MNTNLSEFSGLTVETIGAISSEISLQMSRKLDEVKTVSNTRILDAINTAIEKRCYQASEMLLEAKIQLKLPIRTFGQMDRIRVILVRFIHRGTLGQMDGIQKLLAKRLRMLKRTSPD